MASSRSSCPTCLLAVQGLALLHLCGRPFVGTSWQIFRTIVGGGTQLRCCFKCVSICKGEAKSIAHLFLQCSFSCRVLYHLYGNGCPPLGVCWSPEVRCNRGGFGAISCCWEGAGSFGDPLFVVLFCVERKG